MRLIDADALKTKAETIQTIDCWHMRTEEQAVLVEHIDTAQTIDAVQVVRCKDCFLYGECKAAEWYGENGNGYCSIGDRRKDDE